ncbi:MAG: hypothetical protein ACRD2B_18600 [Terriglobia bacterium]
MERMLPEASGGHLERARLVFRILLGGILAIGFIPVTAWAVRLTLSPGVRVAVRLDDTISTKNHYFGPIVQATLDQDVVDSRGRVAIPAGCTVKLAMAELKRAGHVFGRARIRLRLYSVVLPGGAEVPLDGYATRLDNNRKPGAEGTFHGRRGLVKDAAVDLTAVGTGAGAGFVVGGPWGLPAGAAAGFLTAGVWTVARRGPDLVLPAGTVIEFTLSRPADIDVPSENALSSTDYSSTSSYSPEPSGPVWGQGLAIPPSPDLVALLDEISDPKLVLHRLSHTDFRNRPDSDRVFATYLRGVCELRLSKPKNALEDLERAYRGAKRLNLPEPAQSEIARNLVIALKESSRNWQTSPLMNDPELQAVLVEPEGGE